jgi:hypothetical protein
MKLSTETAYVPDPPVNLLETLRTAFIETTRTNSAVPAIRVSGIGNNRRTLREGGGNALTSRMERGWQGQPKASCTQIEARSRYEIVGVRRPYLERREQSRGNLRMYGIAR